jgi:hypothetical protein
MERTLISRDEALKLVNENISNDKLIKHMISVEAIMRGLAKKLGEDEELWGLIGLLHDIDYEKTMNEFNKHGLLSAEILKEKLPSEALDAIRAHNEVTGFKCDSSLSKALIACDQLSGLIIATALVMPNKKLSEVKVKSLVKKFKQKDFARNVRRDKILACEELGLELREFMEIGLRALQSISDDLGL